MPTVARAEVEDLETVRSVRLRALAEAPYAFGSTLQRETDLSHRDWHRRFARGPWFVAWDGQQPVGLVAALTPDEKPDCRELVSMWVDPTVRGTGVAGDLVQAVVEWATSDGAAAVLLWVADGNDRARRFYERMGFTLTGGRQGLPSDPAVGEAEMARPLTAG